MTETPERRAGLAQLLQGVLVEEEPDAALLARYVDDRASLSPEQIAEVEAAAERSSRVAAELEVLSRFDLGAALAEVDASEAPADAPAQAAPGTRDSWLDRLRIHLGAGPLVALGSAAAAGLAVVVLFGAAEEAPQQDGLQLAFEVDDPLPARSAPAPTPIAPAAEGPRVFARTGERPTASTQPVETATAPPVAKPPEPEPTQIATLPSEQRTTLFRGRELAPQASAEASPTLRYRAPLGSRARPRIVPPSTGPAVRALAPGHTARTAQAQPVLLWHLPRPLPSGGRLSFSLSPAGAQTPDVEAELARPRGAGIQSISTADFGVSLAERREYRWEVRYDGAGARALTEAWIERVPGRGGLPADPVERAEAQARAGLWYDALATLRAAPASPAVDAALQSLLRDGGLPETLGR